MNMEQNEIKRDKRYLVFGCYIQYPYGGLDDLKGSFDSAQEARDYANSPIYDFIEIYDRIEGVLIYTTGLENDLDIRLPSEV